MREGEEHQRQLLTIAVDASVSAFTPYDVQDGAPAVPIELALAAAGKVLLAATEAGNWHVQCLAGMGGTHFRLQRLLGSVPLRKDTVKPVLARVSSISAPRHLRSCTCCASLSATAGWGLEGAGATRVMSPHSAHNPAVQQCRARATGWEPWPCRQPP